MERRVLLAITLSFLVLFLFQRFVMPPPAELPSNASAPATTPSTASQPVSQATPNQSPVAPATPVAPAPPVAPATVGESSAREFVVETSKVRATFSNHGGVITHWVMKE